MAGRASVFGASAYCASKHAAVAMNKTLAEEIYMINKRVNVVSVEPWFYKTNLMSPRPLLSVVDSQWSKASDKLRKLHGGENYIRMVRNGTKFFFTSSYSIDPDLNEVVDTLVEAVTSREPNSVYRVSRWEKVIPLKAMIEWAPIEWRDVIGSRAYNLIMKYSANFTYEPIDVNNNGKIVQ